jgi:hypothetical protein
MSNGFGLTVTAAKPAIRKGSDNIIDVLVRVQAPDAPLRTHQLLTQKRILPLRFENQFVRLRRTPYHLRQLSSHDIQLAVVYRQGNDGDNGQGEIHKERKAFKPTEFSA